MSEEQEPQTERFSPGYSRYVLGVLFCVYVFNFIDPIKEELGESDTQMGS